MTIDKEQLNHNRVIYSYEEQQDSQIRNEGYAIYARLIRGIIEALGNRYGVRYELYASDDPNSEYWDLLKEDLQSNSTEVELVARIFEDLELRTLHYEDDGDAPTYGVHYSIRNNVFAYPEWGVALVRIPFFRENGIYNEDFVFATGEEELKRFLGSVRERERQQNMKKSRCTRMPAMAVTVMSNRLPALSGGMRSCFLRKSNRIFSVRWTSFSRRIVPFIETMIFLTNVASCCTAILETEKRPS